MSRDQAHRRVDREAPLLLGDVLLEDVGLNRAAEAVRRDPLLLGRDHVEGEQDRGGRVDRHRDGHLVERDSVEQGLHVVDRVEGDALHAHLAQRARVVGVEAHQRRHVERRRESGLAVVEEVAEALVGLLDRAEARELAHRPQPPAVHRGVDAAGVGELARMAEVAVGVPALEVLLGVERLDGLPRDGLEERVPLGLLPVGLVLPLVRAAARIGLDGHGRNSTGARERHRGGIDSRRDREQTLAVPLPRRHRAVDRRGRDPGRARRRPHRSHPHLDRVRRRRHGLLRRGLRLFALEGAGQARPGARRTAP